jgi:hypothetical protein
MPTRVQRLLHVTSKKETPICVFFAEIPREFLIFQNAPARRKWSSAMIHATKTFGNWRFLGDLGHPLVVVILAIEPVDLMPKIRRAATHRSGVSRLSHSAGVLLVSDT